jgi:similar to stage IV sporulation protein
MPLIKLLRFIQGYAVIEATGGFPERFINLCTRNRIPLWNIGSQGGVIRANTTVSSLPDIERTAEKSGMEINVTRVSSLKETLLKHKNRKGLIISLFICLMLTAVLSSFIWSVSVEGNEKYTKEDILSAFEEQGIKIGALKRKIDTREVSEKAIAILPDLSWAKVNIRGCFAVIEVRESIKKPYLLDENTPVNIVAKKDGQIMKYEVSKGDGLLKTGIAVTKGELLVSGVLTNSDGSERLVHAKAKVTAKVSYSVKGKYDKKLFSLSDETINKSVFFFGLTIPSYDRENAFESKRYLDSNKRILPLGFFRYRRAQYENKYETDSSATRLLNAFCFNKSVSEIYENAENVLSKKIKTDESLFTGEIICEEDIGLEKEILLG